MALVSKENAQREEAVETPREEKSQIVYIQRYTKDDGTPGEKVHGPMDVDKWAAYEKENGL